MKVATIHNFQQSLRQNEKWIDWPGWEKLYRLAFPTMVSMQAIKTDGWAQRGGIDRLIILSSGKIINIEEKVRPESNYQDILLEYYSNTERKIPGWIAKDLACDYIAYLIIKTEVCYLIPFHALRLAWKKYRVEWVKKYTKVEAKNQGFVTTSVAVPVNVLIKAISDNLYFSLKN